MTVKIEPLDVETAKEYARAYLADEAVGRTIEFTGIEKDGWRYWLWLVSRFEATEHDPEQPARIELAFVGAADGDAVEALNHYAELQDEIGALKKLPKLVEDSLYGSHAVVTAEYGSTQAAAWAWVGLVSTPAMLAALVNQNHPRTLRPVDDLLAEYGMVAEVQGEAA